MEDIVVRVVSGFVVLFIGIIALLGMIFLYHGFRVFIHIATNYPHKLLQVIFCPKGTKALKEEIGSNDPHFNKLEEKTKKAFKRCLIAMLSFVLIALLFVAVTLILGKLLPGK